MDGAAVLKPPKNSKELASAVYDDFKRQAVDSAKKRAVAQRVDYDTFKNMVSVAHLKPLHAPSDRQNGAMQPSWRFAADGSKVCDTSLSSEASALSADVPNECPSTSGDFCRDWRRNCPTPESKYVYLRHTCGCTAIRSVFNVEVPSAILSDALSVLDMCWMGAAGAAEDDSGEGAALKEAAAVIQLLHAFSGTGRFNLTVKLLGPDSKPVIARLFNSLQQALTASVAAATSEEGSIQAEAVGMCDQQQLDVLSAAYGIKLH